jgi:hypothetical protein
VICILVPICQHVPCNEEQLDSIPTLVHNKPNSTHNLIIEICLLNTIDNVLVLFFPQSKKCQFVTWQNCNFVQQLQRSEGFVDKHFRQHSLFPRMIMSKSSFFNSECEIDTQLAMLLQRLKDTFFKVISRIPPSIKHFNCPRRLFNNENSLIVVVVRGSG